MLENITNEHHNISEVLLQHVLPIITLIGIRGQIQPIFRLFTNKNIIFVSKNLT